MGQGRRHFTDEFKQEAIALLVSSGRPFSQIASELGISPSMLRNLRNGSGGGGAGSALPPIPASAPHPVPDPAAEISRLRRENDRLRMERDILKKLWPSSWKPRNEVPPDRDQRGVVRVMCDALSASPSGYYAWRSRPESPRKDQCPRLPGKICRTSVMPTVTAPAILYSARFLSQPHPRPLCVEQFYPGRFEAGADLSQGLRSRLGGAGFQ